VTEFPPGRKAGVEDGPATDITLERAADLVPSTALGFPLTGMAAKPKQLVWCGCRPGEHDDTT
jgi:hypothetical protein